MREYIATDLRAIAADEYFRYLAESAMQPYGAQSGERADRLVELTAALTRALA